MAPLVLEGHTLGQRHRHYNQLVAAAVADDTAELLPLNHDEPDVDNLLRIDVACRRRHLQYVLDVLQCDDMLYVSRAIKQSTWLITDDQYAHIINPQHLHDELFPKMMSKAKNKLLLAIRLNLKNPTRGQEFFNYYYSNNKRAAIKWLPLSCSPKIKNVLYNIYKLGCREFKRLCENDHNNLKYVLEHNDYYKIEHLLHVSRVLLHTYPEEYLNIILTINDDRIPFFGVRTTRRMMQECPEKLLNNFQKLHTNIHIPTLAKCLNEDNVRDFLLQQAKDEKMESWFTYENIRHFVKYIPAEGRFAFIKEIFSDREILQPNVPVADTSCRSKASGASKAAVKPFDYRWYHFATFTVAFNDIKKLIRDESSPQKRTDMLIILIHCARRDTQQVQDLLQFYREKHINESHIFKTNFVNTLLSTVATHKFDVKTWGILNDILSSMEVYMETDNDVHNCVKAIMVYKLLHNEEIPDTILQKYLFDTFIDYRKKLEQREQDKIFTYVYNTQMDKLNSIQNRNICDVVDMEEALASLGNILTLLRDWKKNISEFPEILKKIKYIVKSKKEHVLNNDLSFIFFIEKKWRRHMFEESLALMRPTDRTCYNALKHDPALLQRFNDDVVAMYSNDAVSLKHTLNKIRIYWNHTLAETWTHEYLEGLNKPTGHKATFEGLSVLLPRKRFICLLEKYAPVQTKIDWNVTDTTLFSLQKNIVKFMKFVRPSINLSAVLSYAKGDYLQYTLPSLNALTYNMNAAQVSEYIPALFDSPVSLSKHGLRLAYTKLKFSEIKGLVENIWKNTKNSSIKTVLFLETFELLKSSKKDTTIRELWDLLSMFIDNLTPDEDRKIYVTLGKAENVPLIVRPQFFEKCYIYLKSLPLKADCANILGDWIAIEIIDKLESSFVENFLLPSVKEIVSMTSTPDCMNILAAYLINSENEKTQENTYEKYLVPILDRWIKSLKTNSHMYGVRLNCSEFLGTLISQGKRVIFKKPLIYLKTFRGIENKLRSSLPIDENYCFLTEWSLILLFMDTVYKYIEGECDNRERMEEIVSKDRTDNENIDDKENDERWKQLCTAVAPVFGKTCLVLLKQDVSSLLCSVATPFANTLTRVMDLLSFGDLEKLVTLKSMLDSDFMESYIASLKGTNNFGIWYDDKNVLDLRNEIYGIIKAYPSTYVKMLYYEFLYSHSHVIDYVSNENIIKTDRKLCE